MNIKSNCAVLIYGSSLLIFLFLFFFLGVFVKHQRVCTEPTIGYFGISAIMSLPCFRDWPFALIGFSFYAHPNVHHFTYFEALSVIDYAVKHQNVVLYLDSVGEG